MRSYPYGFLCIVSFVSQWLWLWLRLLQRWFLWQVSALLNVLIVFCSLRCIITLMCSHQWDHMGIWGCNSKFDSLTKAKCWHFKILIGPCHDNKGILSVEKRECLGVFLEWTSKNIVTLMGQFGVRLVSTTNLVMMWYISLPLERLQIPEN